MLSVQTESRTTHKRQLTILPGKICPGRGIFVKHCYHNHTTHLSGVPVHFRAGLIARGAPPGMLGCRMVTQCEAAILGKPELKTNIIEIDVANQCRLRKSMKADIENYFVKCSPKRPIPREKVIPETKSSQKCNRNTARSRNSSLMIRSIHPHLASIP